jgi:(R,R)-butanediol dehydrogenase/meso-butanediol dehydrogenase/diacetyl reductase
MPSTYAVLAPPSRCIELRVRDCAPRAGQVLVHVRACGICRGDLNDFLLARDAACGFGHEPVGQVAAVGDGVTGFAEGDWVVGSLDGGFADYAVGDAANLFPIPATLGAFGALVEPIKCVTTNVRAIAADYGDTVAVVGCGFMGLAALAALAGGGVAQLVAVETDPGRQALARDCGATHVIDPTVGDAVAHMRALTDGQGADAAIDFAGSQTATTLAAHLLRTRGRLAAAAGFLPLDQHWDVYMKALTIMNTPPMFSPDPAGDWQRTIAAMAQGRYPLDRLLTHRFPLADIQRGFQISLTGDGGRYLKGIIVNDA